MIRIYDLYQLNWLPHKVINHGESIEITTANENM